MRPQRRPWVEHNFSQRIVTKRGKPRAGLIRLLYACGIEHDGTLEDIVQQTQRAWLRPAGLEIWQTPEKKFRNEADIRACLQELRLFSQVNPRNKRFDYLIIFGAVFEGMLERVAFAHRLLEAGKIIAPQMVFLVGERALDHEEESREKIEQLLRKYPKKLFAFPPSGWNKLTTELDIPLFLVSNLAFSPKSPIKHFVMIFTATQGARRPNTADTLLHWLTKGPEQASRCLFVSSGRHVQYQDAVVRRVLAQKNYFLRHETVGPAGQDISVTAYLDIVARWLYEEQQRLLLEGVLR